MQIEPPKTIEEAIRLLLHYIGIVKITDDNVQKVYKRSKELQVLMQSGGLWEDRMPYLSELEEHIGYTADVTVTLPSSAGTVALTSDIPSAGISSGNVATFTSGAADNDFLRIDGTAIEGRSASEVLSDIGGQASLTFGISDTNAVKIDSSSVADDEFARFTANGLESRSASEVLSDIGATTAAAAADEATALAIALG